MTTDEPTTLQLDEVRALARQLIEEIAREDEEESYFARQEHFQARLEAQHRDLTAEIDRLRLEAASLKAAAEHHPLLSDIAAVLAGKITHAVFPDSYTGPMIQTAPDAFTRTEPNRYGGREEVSVRLVSLLPPNDGRAYSHRPNPTDKWTTRLGWYVNEWSDGSGIDSPVILCQSSVEAEDAVRRLFAEAVAEFDADVGRTRRDSRRWQRFADTGIDLPWPDHILENFRAQAVAGHEAAITRAREALNEALAKSTPVGIDITGTTPPEGDPR
jgi:hypothetical protein